MATFPEDGAIVKELVAKATTTMYVAKSRGSGQIGFYSPPSPGTGVKTAGRAAAPGQGRAALQGPGGAETRLCDALRRIAPGARPVVA